MLTELQAQYSVQFNYASTLVDSVTVNYSTRSAPIKEIVSDLGAQSNLDFVFISDKIISIKNKEKILCGYIKDRYTKEVLPFVTIQNGNKGVISNEEGYFEIAISSDEDLIRIRHIGHKTLSRQANNFELSADCKAIYLDPNYEQLSEIVVYDYLTQGVDKLDNGAFQLKLNKMRLLPGLIDKDVLHGVQSFAGIHSIDETVSNINIRGGSNDQNLISWDGIKMYQSGHFFGLISMYNSNITQKVELYKNGTSAAETDGVSGTIAMTTDKFINKKLKGNIGVNFLDVNGFVDVPISKKASLQVAARKSISDFIDTPTYGEYFNRIAQNTEIENHVVNVINSGIDFDFYDASFRALYQPSNKDRFQLNFIQTANALVFNEREEVNGAEEVKESSLNQNSTAASLKYQRTWSEKFRSELSIYESEYQLKGINANILKNQRFLQKNTVSETSFKFLGDLELSPQVHWINGYHLVETQINNLDDVDRPQYLFYESKVLRTYGVFSEIKWALNKLLFVNIGLRHNYLDKFNTQIWEPRFSLNYKFLKYFKVEALGEFKHQNISQIINFQSDFLGVEKRRWQIADNKTIPVIRSKQASLGLSYSRNKWLINAETYFKRVNGITAQSQGFQDQFEFAKTSGSYDAIGIDVLTRKRWKNTNTWISYSFLRSKYIFKELLAQAFPNNYDVTHTVTFGASYSLNDLIFATGLNWRTGRPFTRPVEGQEVINGIINFDTSNTSRQEDYLRLDLSSTYQFNFAKNKKVEIGLSILNVLNRKNTLHTFYRLDDEDQIKKVEQNSLRITPNASFKYIF